MRLRNHVVVLVASTLFPILIAMAAAIVVLTWSGQAAIERGLQSTARTLTSLVEREVLASFDALEVLATSPSLAEGRVERFYDVAQRSLTKVSQWQAITLLEPSGNVIFNTGFPLGTPLPSMAGRPHVQQVVDTGRAAVSPVLLSSRLIEDHVLPVAVPVYVDGTMKYILVAAYPALALSRLFDSIHLDEQASATVIDRNGMILARFRRASEYVGQRTAPDVLDALAEGRERTLVGKNVEGVRSFMAINPSSSTGWTIVSGVPLDEYRAPLWRSLALVGGGGILLILAGCLGAAWVGRRIAGSIHALAAPAEALGRGESVAIEPTSKIKEVQDLAEALRRASVLIQDKSCERDAALRDSQIRARHQQAIAIVGQLAFEEINLSVLLQQVTEILAAALEAELCQLLQLGTDGKSFVLCAGVGWDPSLKGTAQIDVGDRSHAGYALLHQGPIIVDNFAEEQRFEPSPLVREYGAVSGINVILHAKGRSFGVLGAYSRTPHAFNDDDAQFCQSIAYLLSTILVRRDDDLHLRLLAEENAQFAAAIHAMGSGVVITDATQADNPIIFVNPAFTAMTGYAAHEAIGRNSRFLQGAETDAATVKILGEAIAELRPVTVTLCNYRKTGEIFWNELTVTPIPHGADGSRFFVGIQTDVSARRTAEDQLRQAQKIEAVGQLTAGIAHDFNNLLNVILGNSDFLIEEFAGDKEIVRMASEILQAGERAADLTKRLLAFARSQPLLPERIDVNLLVAGTETLLRRTLGEHIVIVKTLEAVLPEIKVDRSQLETAILNLAVNARDAMPDGGTLTLTTDFVTFDEDSAAKNPDARPGHYVLLSVADSGIGMPPAVLAKVFEPFFTTKDVGKGTGLGLSMVYGFIRQSGGFIEIGSEVGRGTDVRLYLPKAAQNSHDVAAARILHTAIQKKGTETILVVEDDDLVAGHVVRQLTSLGYRIIRAPEAGSALVILAQNASIDLLFTDIVMPGGMNGIKLAEEARRLFPRLKILLTSGYIEASAGEEKLAAQGVRMLQKPYRRIELAETIRHVLDSTDYGTPPLLKAG